jgi:hypothetical protein
MRFEGFIDESTKVNKDVWAKYFADKGEVDTKMAVDAKLYGMDGTPAGDIESNSSVTVMDTLPPTRTKWSGKTDMVIVTYNSALYKVKFSSILKPITKGATEALRINADNLTPIASTKMEMVGGAEFEFKYWSSTSDLKASLSQGINNNKLIPDYLKENLNEYLEQSTYSTITWDERVSNSQMNELGKYLGELIIGLLLLNNELGIAGIVSKGGVDEFLIPSDSAFEGIDSLFIKTGGIVVPISSKFGVGAKASWFSNILKPAIKNSKILNSKIMKASVAIGKNMNPSRQGKEILYTFGYQYILNGVLPRGVKPLDVYYDISKGVMSPVVQDTFEAIKKFRGNLEGSGNVKQAILKDWPNSLTSFFSRAMAQMLNDDPTAVDDMLTILGAKDFLQANLHIGKWKKGTVSYSFVKSGSSKLHVIGSKAKISDLTGKQGMVNYELS